MRGLTKNISDHTGLRWGLAGIALVSPLVVVAAISPGFDYELRNIDKPIISMVVLLIVAGGIYLLAILGFKETVFNKKWLAWVILLGLLARIIMFTSTPILEDDYNRYLWDGGVLANGFNPYKYSPRDVLNEEVHQVPDALRQLAKDAVPIPQRINYPWLRTIYPPITQCVFAIAHIISPWSLMAWRIVVLVLDLVTLYLLFSILRVLNLPLTGLAIYWWNPLLIKEIYNSGHMDVLIFPFVLGALLLTMQRRYVLASAILGLGLGVKFWPAILLPVALRPVLNKPKTLVPAVLVFACLSVAMVMPQWLTGLGSDSGLTAYSRYWEMNDALFMIILWIAELVIEVFGSDADYAKLVARVVVVGILLFWSLWVIRLHDVDPAETSRRFLLVVAALFLLSPTQFPWYYLWILPFLAIHPRISLALLTVLLPLYYMRFYLGARDMVKVHDMGVVWLEFVPVWCILIWEWRRGVQKKSRMGKGAG